MSDNRDNGAAPQRNNALYLELIIYIDWRITHCYLVLCVLEIRKNDTNIHNFRSRSR